MVDQLRQSLYYDIKDSILFARITEVVAEAKDVYRWIVDIFSNIQLFPGLICVGLAMIVAIRPILIPVCSRRWFRKSVLVPPDLYENSMIDLRIDVPGIGSSLLIAFGTLGIFFVGNDIIIALSNNCGDNCPQAGNVGTIIAAASAILFPFIVLLLERDSDSSSNGLPTSEVFFYHSRIYPVGVSLITQLGIICFSFHNISERVLGVASVILAAIPFVRLTTVVLIDSVRSEAEAALINVKVNSELLKSARYRRGLHATRIRSDEASQVKYVPFSFVGEGNERVDIVAPTSGEVDDIDWDQLDRIGLNLKSALGFSLAEQLSGTQGGGIPTTPKPDATISVRASEGSTVTKFKSILAFMDLPKNVEKKNTIHL